MLYDVSTICYDQLHTINFTSTKGQKEDERTIQPFKRICMEEFP